MAPPRKILRQQLEILINFLEENKEMSKGMSPASPVSHQATRQKWILLAKNLNGVYNGSLKTPEGWKKYWFEWRHKCRKKAADVRRFQSGSNCGRNRFIPLNDLEVRVLELSGKGSVTPTVSTSQQLDDFLAEDSDSEQTLDIIKAQVAPAASKTKQSTINTSRTSADENSQSASPPPKWAIDLEERRIAAEERMADALSSMASIMRSQEERRVILEERIADALTAIAGTVQDLNSGIQEAVQHLQQIYPLQPNGPGLKDEVFM